MATRVNLSRGGEVSSGIFLEGMPGALFGWIFWEVTFSQGKYWGRPGNFTAWVNRSQCRITGPYV